jgi:hypothetical protein
MVNFAECLAERNTELTKWTSAIAEEVRTGLATRTAEKICNTVCANILKLKDPNYNLPNEAHVFELSFSFNIAKGFCTELSESLAEDSVIKGWVDRLKEWQESLKKSHEDDAGSMIYSGTSKLVLSKTTMTSLRPNYAAWNEHADTIADAVKDLIGEKLKAVKQQNTVNNIPLLDFKVEYTHNKPQSHAGVLDVAFWVPTKPAAAKSGGGLSSLFSWRSNSSSVYT